MFNKVINHKMSLIMDYFIVNKRKNLSVQLTD